MVQVAREALTSLERRVVDIKGRDSRREIGRFNSPLEFYADRVVQPETWSLH